MSTTTVELSSTAPETGPSEVQRPRGRLGLRVFNYTKALFGLPAQRRLAQAALQVPRIRYWEKEFPTLRPERKSKQRLYRRKDVETVFIIKRLLYQEGFTIEGARKQLSSNSEELKQQTLLRSAPDGIELKAIKRELESILTILSRKC